MKAPGQATRRMWMWVRMSHHFRLRRRQRVYIPGGRHFPPLQGRVMNKLGMYPLKRPNPKGRSVTFWKGTPAQVTFPNPYTRGAYHQRRGNIRPWPRYSRRQGQAMIQVRGDRPFRKERPVDRLERHWVNTTRMKRYPAGAFLWDKDQAKAYVEGRAGNTRLLDLLMGRWEHREGGVDWASPSPPV